MKRIPLTGSTRWIGLLCINDAEGAATAADSLPAIDVWADGSPMSTFATITVGAVATGVYIAELTLTGLLASAPWAAGVVWHGWWTYTLDGVESVTPIEPFMLVPGLEGAVVASDGGNTATTFKTENPSGSLLDTTDDAKECLIAFLSGALAGQVRKVTAYNAATSFLTVDLAFSAAPSAGDVFKIINE
jgi:hypothetical protein